MKMGMKKMGMKKMPAAGKKMSTGKGSMKGNPKTVKDTDRHK